MKESTTLRVLIVSPHFPPSSAPDMQRVRLLIPYFRQNGVEAEVLAVESEQAQAPVDAWLQDGLPGDIPVHRVSALARKWARIPGFGGLGLRALPALWRRGASLLSSRHFDLVYFSTTVFEVHVLGPRWKRRFGVPFVLDYQDPWVNDYYREHADVVPPGGRLKYAMVDRLHRLMEPRVLAECSGITAVSPAYLVQLGSRYPWLPPLPTLVQGFPAEAKDHERAELVKVDPAVLPDVPGTINWVYAGVVNAAMLGTLRALFHALHGADAQLRDRLRLHFIGTSYATGASARPAVSPVAREFGMEQLVREHPERVPYSVSLACLSKAHALLVIGSDDPGYAASKIYPYLLARKPVLAVVHKNSPVAQVMRQVRGGVCVTFSQFDTQESLARTIADAWLDRDQHATAVPLDVAAFEPYRASSAARVMSDFFRRAAKHAG